MRASVFSAHQETDLFFRLCLTLLLVGADSVSSGRFRLMDSLSGKLLLQNSNESGIVFKRNQACLVWSISCVQLSIIEDAVETTKSSPEVIKFCIVASKGPLVDALMGSRSSTFRTTGIKTLFSINMKLSISTPPCATNLQSNLFYNSAATYN
jgi:hypothetical protein